MLFWASYVTYVIFILFWFAETEQDNDISIIDVQFF